MRTKPASTRKPAISPTKLSTYLECAVKYRYIYIDKIGRFYMKSRAAFSFGSTLHQVLQQYHEPGAERSLTGMLSRFEEGWISAGYASAAQEQEHQAAGEQILLAYHASAEARQEELGPVETIATERTISCDMGRFKLTGRVDRIDLHVDGTLEVVDYKSGRLTVTEEEVAASLAMNCYQLILSKMYPGAPVCATIYCLRSGESATARLTEEGLAEFERDIRDVADVILDMDWLETAPVRIEHCADCDFLSRCEGEWRRQERARRLHEEPAEDEQGFSEFGL